MKDSERLDLLKEIGGTRVYEERRRESLKIMQETGTLLSKFMLLEYQCCVANIFENQVTRESKLFKLFNTWTRD